MAWFRNSLNELAQPDCREFLNRYTRLDPTCVMKRGRQSSWPAEKQDVPVWVSYLEISQAIVRILRRFAEAGAAIREFRCKGIGVG